jgi:hypothetical protein
MSCLFDKSIIQKYADDTIDPLELVFLKEHMNYCAECRKEAELAKKLEYKLEKFFVDDPGMNNLDFMIENLVEDCMYELNNREKLKYILRKYMRLGRGIRHNTTRFPPNRKTARNTPCFFENSPFLRRRPPGKRLRKEA